MTNYITEVYRPSLALVFGYLKGIDKISKTAKEHQLKERFSIAFDSYNPLKNEVYFDSDMFENLFTEVFKLIEGDRIEIQYGKTLTHVFNSFSDAIELIRHKDADEGLICDKIFAYQNGNMVCCIETEYYTSIGGPHPYHDTFNFACFVNQMNRIYLEAIIRKKCEENKYLIRVVEVGFSEPQSSSLWNRYKNIF